MPSPRPSLKQIVVSHVKCKTKPWSILRACSWDEASSKRLMIALQRVSLGYKSLLAQLTVQPITVNSDFSTDVKRPAILTSHRNMLLTHKLSHHPYSPLIPSPHPNRFSRHYWPHLILHLSFCRTATHSKFGTLFPRQFYSISLLLNLDLIH